MSFIKNDVISEGDLNSALRKILPAPDQHDIL